MKRARTDDGQTAALHFSYDWKAFLGTVLASCNVPLAEAQALWAARADRTGRSRAETPTSHYVKGRFPYNCSSWMEKKGQCPLVRDQGLSPQEAVRRCDAEALRRPPDYRIGRKAFLSVEAHRDKQ
jgi:hypothetical protein